MSEEVDTALLEFVMTRYEATPERALTIIANHREAIVAEFEAKQKEDATE